MTDAWLVFMTATLTALITGAVTLGATVIANKAERKNRQADRIAQERHLRHVERRDVLAAVITEARRIADTDEDFRKRILECPRE